MKKNLIIACICVLLAGSAVAQTPTPSFNISTWTGGSPKSAFTFRNIIDRFQSIYYPTDFPTIPAKAITNVYLRIGRLYNTTTSVTVHNMIIRLGTTLDSGFSHPGGYDTFKTGMMTVFSQASYTFNGCDTVGKWFKIPVSSDFTYSRNGNLVFEIMHSGEPSSLGISGFDWMANNLTQKVPHSRTLFGKPDSLRSINNNNYNFFDLGFDVSTLGVAGLSNVSSFGLFPNPSTDGRFNVSFDTKLPVQNVSVTVTNMVGQEILNRHYAAAGSSFFREVDLHNAAKGMYILTVQADDERIVRRLVVE